MLKGTLWGKVENLRVGRDFFFLEINALFFATQFICFSSLVHLNMVNIFLSFFLKNVFGVLLCLAFFKKSAGKHLSSLLPVPA